LEQRLGCNDTVKRIFSTDDIAPRDRYDCWHEIVRKQTIEHDSYPDSRMTFEATLDAADIGDLSLVSFETAAMSVVHEKRHFDANAGELLLVRQIAGNLTLEQNAHRVGLEPGHMTLIEPQMIYSARFTNLSRLLVVKFPRRSLAARVGRTDAFIARPLAPQPGEAGLLSQILGLLPEHTESLGSGAPRVADQVLDLLAVMLSKADAGATPRLSHSRAMLGMQLRAAVDRHLQDPAITSDSIAKSVGISLRYANAILGDEETSVSRLILTRRLERCRQALADPTQMHRSISSIAFAWGFSDMTHFGRRFRGSFGLLPSEYRKLSVKAAPDS
jgi:AraC family transcriptional activator of tynA and feaB